MRKTKSGRDEEVPFLLELRNADQGIKEIEDRMAVVSLEVQAKQKEMGSLKYALGVRTEIREVIKKKSEEAIREMQEEKGKEKGKGKGKGKEKE